MDRTNPPPPRAQKHRRTRRPSATALDLRAVPSPRPSSSGRSGAAAPERCGDAPADASRAARLSAEKSAEGHGVDWERVEELASKGLTLEQITVEMDWPGLPPPALRARMEAAIKRGRIKGSAALRQKHFESAMKDSVSARRDMLGILESEDDDDEPVEVDEVILDAVEGEDSREPAED